LKKIGINQSMTLLLANQHDEVSSNDKNQKLTSAATALKYILKILLL